MSRHYFVTGIDTGVGKTTICSILVEAFKADYWKPVQTGSFIHSDTERVKSLISNDVSRFHAETYAFPHPVSPHEAAKDAGVVIDLKKIVIPETKNTLIIEGAGGVLVPLNENDLMIDLMKKLGAEVILVSDNYLGSINHTLLSVEMLRSKKIPIKGIIFNSAGNTSSEECILKHTGLKCLLAKPEEPKITKDVILKYSKIIDWN